MKNILHILSTARGGAAIVAEQIACNIDKKQYKPIIVLDSPAASHMRNRLSRNGIQCFSLKNEKTTDKHEPKTGSALHASMIRKSSLYKTINICRHFLFAHLPKVRIYNRIIRECQIDIVHTHNDLRIGKPEIIAAWMNNIPCISHNHMYMHHDSFDTLFSKLVQKFVYVSKDLSLDNIRQGKPASKSIVIHNGVDVQRFGDSFDAGDVRKKFGLQADEKLIGIVGRLVWWKGHQYFIEAIAEVLAQGYNVKGLIIGNLPLVNYELNKKYLEDLKAVVHSSGLKEKIQFTGFRQDVPRLISAMDVVVHASSEPEPFGLVIIEGMAAGKPVVATSEGGVLDIIENNVNGLLVPCKNYRLLAQSIIRLISDPGLCSQIGAAAKMRVLEQFTLQHQMIKVQALYKSILS